MSDETKNDLPVETEDIVGTVIETAIDLVSDQAVPAPIRKGFLAACKRLGTAMVEDAAGHFERRSTEKWAETNARVKIYEETGEQIRQQIKVDPEFPQRASYTFAKQILREQFNREQVLGMTAGILKEKEYDNSENQQSDNKPETPISEDWFNIFEKEASQKSSEDMQRRFAQVLAGEIEKPGSHSIKAIKILGDMDQRIAMFFNTFCSLCIVNLEKPNLFLKSSANFFKIKDARVPIITGIMNFSGNFQQGVGKFAQKSEILYKRYCFGTDQFQLLLEHGLIQDVNTHTDYSHFWYNDEIWGILKPDTFGTEYQEIKISGYSLSFVGKELFHITKRSNPPGHFELLTDFLEECYTVEINKVLF